jgi:hypothetical protein
MAVTVRPGAGPVNGGRPARRSASRSAWAPTIAAMSRFARGLMGFPVLGAGHAPEGFSEEDLRSAVRTRGSVATA